MAKKYIALGVVLGIAIAALTMGVSVAVYRPQEVLIQNTKSTNRNVESSVRIEQI